MGVYEVNRHVKASFRGPTCTLQPTHLDCACANAIAANFILCKIECTVASKLDDGSLCSRICCTVRLAFEAADATLENNASTSIGLPKPKNYFAADAVLHVKASLLTFISGSTCFVTRAWPLMLTEALRSQSSAEAVSTDSNTKRAALLIRTCALGPNFATPSAYLRVITLLN